MKIGGRNIRYAECSSDLKQLLMKVKEASAKEGLHLNLKKTKIMTTKEIHSFNIDNEGIEVVEDFACSGSVINSERNCCQEIKRRLR